MILRKLSHLTPWLVVFAFFAVWEFFVRFGYISPLVLASPIDVFVALAKMLGNSRTYLDIAVTLYEALAGFSIAAVIGIGLGVMLSRYPALQRALQPIIVAVQVTPKIVLAPLFILWFGFGAGSKIVIAAMLCFLPIMNNTMLGIKSIEDSHRDVMRSMEATAFQRLMFLELPSALPAVLTGLEIGIIFAMIGTIIGEFLSGVNGLGHVAVEKLNSFEVDGLFATVLLLSLISATLYSLIVGLRRLLTPWHATARAVLN